MSFVVLTPEQAAAQLYVSTAEAIAMCKAGEIPFARKVGRAWRVLGSPQLDAMVRGRRNVRDCERGSNRWAASRGLREPLFADVPLCGGVYFLRAEVVGLVKIGTAVCLRKRVQAIHSASPVKLSYLGHVEGGRLREVELHAKFDEHRVRGEWFSPADELLEFIRTEATRP